MIDCPALRPFLLAALVLGNASISPAEESRIYQFTPAKLQYTPGPVDNPLRGLVPYQGPRPDRFPYSMEFNYLPLSALVKDPEQYDWSVFDAMLDDIASRGRQTVARVFLEYPGKENVIPEFLVDRGLKVHKYVNTNTAPLPPANIETPDYEDANLRKVMVDFIAAWGKRYDGDPRLAYLTAGMLGTWGEWHTYPKTELWASKEVQKEIYEAYSKAFKKTPILLRYPAGPNDSLSADSLPYAFGYHDDSFAYATLSSGRPEDDWFFLPTMKRAALTERWKEAPIGGEIRPEVWGCCFDEPPCTAPTQGFAACRDQLHATWLMDTGLNQKEKASPERYDRAIAAVQKMGYDIEVAAVSAETSAEDSIAVTVTLRNRGIAPFYHHGWHAKLQLLAQGNDKPIVINTDWSPRLIQPGEVKTFAHTIDTSQLRSGKHELRLRLPNPMPGGKPLRFANENVDPETGSLTLATLSVQSDQNR